MLLDSISKKTKSSGITNADEIVSTVEMLGFSAERSVNWRPAERQWIRGEVPYDCGKEQLSDLLKKYPKKERPSKDDICVSGSDKVNADGGYIYFPKYMIANTSIIVSKDNDSFEIVASRDYKGKREEYRISEKFLKFLYKHNAQKLASEIIGDRKRKKEFDEQTSVSNDTCGACERKIHATTDNKIMRHGWRGVIDFGQQLLYQSECPGWGCAPLEDSPEGIVRKKDRIIVDIDKLEKRNKCLSDKTATIAIEDRRVHKLIDKDDSRYDALSKNEIERNKNIISNLRRDLEYTRKRISSWKMDYSRGLLKSILA